MILTYDASQEERDRLIAERQAKMFAAFERMREQIDKRTTTMNMSTVSEKVQRQQLEELRHEIQKELGSFYSDLETGLKSDMEMVGQSVLKESEGFYNALNMPIAMKITSFPVEVMNNIVNGTVYEQKWFLSNALWGDYQDKLADINEVITEGIGLNLSTYEIAKNLEQYVDPSARKEWAWSKVYPGTAKKVDYNAQRLARTLINHAYQQNVVQHAKANPFSKGVKWLASGGKRMCEICEERDGKVYPPDDVPLDHPNGMCAFEVVTEDLMTISNTLADFVNGVPTEYDDKLYDWYNDRAVNPEQKPKKEIDKNDKEFKKWWSNLKSGKLGKGTFGDITDIIDFEYGKVTADTRLEFYKKYIVGDGEMPSMFDVRFNKLKNEVKFNQCKDLLFKETSSKAVSVLSGGDMTGGSCASLALAYIGRRNGIDVIDFRGGKSRDWFSDKSNKRGLADLIGANVKSYDNEQGKNGFSILREAGLEPNKEYLVGYSRHMAVVRHDGKGHFEYLELQSPVSARNRWQSLNAESMEWRFGGASAKDKTVDLYDFSNFDYDKYKEALGYINTSERDQQKGIGGTIK